MQRTKILGLILLFCVPVFAKPVLNIQHWNTTNGAKVLFVESHNLPILDIAVTFVAGSAQDGKQFGVAQFTSAMLNEGSTTLSADQIATNFDNVGAIFTANAGRDMASVQLRSLSDPKMLNPALQTFIDVLSKPIFSQTAFKRVQQQILSAIKQSQQQPTSVASNTFYQTLYGKLPYAHPVLGTTNTIQQLTPQDLQNFYHKYYVAKNALITIVGDVSLTQAKVIANQVIKNLPQGKAIVNLKTTPVIEKATNKHIAFPAQQTTALIGQAGIAQNAPAFFPLMVGNFILGGSPLTSELFQEVRNKRGLAYSVGSSFTPLKNPGPFIIFLQTRNDKSQEAIQVSQNTLEHFVDKGPTKQQLQDAKRSIIGRFPLQIANNSQILALITTIGFYNLPWDYVDTYRAKVKAVTAEQVKVAFQQLIKPQKLLIVTVGQ